MNFERGKDPRSKMEIGHTATAPIVYRLLFEEPLALGESRQRYSQAIGMSSERTAEILRNIQHHPQAVHNYYAEFMDKEGRIFSGISPLSEYSGKVVQYRGEIFLIPEA